MRNPTQRSLKHLRDRKYAPFVVEYYNPWAKRKTDLYHFIDLVAIHPAETGVLGIQTTTGDNLSARVKKAEALPAYWAWLAAQNDVEFHGWRKIKAGKKVATWQVRLIKVSFKHILS